MSYCVSSENVQNHGHGNDTVIQAGTMHINNWEQSLQGHGGMRHSVPSPKTNTAVPYLLLRILPELSKLLWRQRLHKQPPPSTTDSWGRHLFPTRNVSGQNTAVSFSLARLNKEFSLHLPPNAVDYEHPCCSSWNLSCWSTNSNVVFLSLYV